ncbi:hypothetical protein BX257_4991 [Streptomyces sp. 3212.3]|nr:hypothetical protein BX257_4991 [Streptomyces sp. 3212.3]
MIPCCRCEPYSGLTAGHWLWPRLRGPRRMRGGRGACDVGTAEDDGPVRTT